MPKLEDILPSGFYYRPQPIVIPEEGCYVSIWTYQYLDDHGGLLPDIEVLLILDPFALVLGGVVVAIYSHFDGEIYGIWKDNISAWPQADDWIEDMLCIRRLYYCSVMYVFLVYRYFRRILAGSFAYVIVRCCTHLVWNWSLRVVSSSVPQTSFGVMWASGTIFCLGWTSYYTRQHITWNVLCGLWAGFGMSVMENLYEIFCAQYRKLF